MRRSSGVSRRPNILRAEFEYDDADPPGYRAGIVRVGREAGGQELAVKLFELPAGEGLCPYHYEYVEEWLIVLDGPVAVRTPDGTHELEPGDVVSFPPGPAGAHKVINRGDTAARIVMFSSSREPSVAVYPDSDKMGVWPGNDEDTVMLRRADSHLDYYDGEV
jgi:uncharacterized cupin superfamily protein